MAVQINMSLQLVKHVFENEISFIDKPTIPMLSCL